MRIEDIRPHMIITHGFSDYYSERFWMRDELEECPKVESGQYWQRLPKPLAV